MKPTMIEIWGKFTHEELAELQEAVEAKSLVELSLTRISKVALQLNDIDTMHGCSCDRCTKWRDVAKKWKSLFG